MSVRRVLPWHGVHGHGPRRHPDLISEGVRTPETRLWMRLRCGRKLSVYVAPFISSATLDSHGISRRGTKPRRHRRDPSAIATATEPRPRRSPGRSRAPGRRRRVVDRWLIRNYSAIHHPTEMGCSDFETTTQLPQPPRAICAMHQHHLAAVGVVELSLWNDPLSLDSPFPPCLPGNRLRKPPDFP